MIIRSPFRLHEKRGGVNSCCHACNSCSLAYQQGRGSRKYSSYRAGLDRLKSGRAKALPALPLAPALHVEGVRER